MTANLHGNIQIHDMDQYKEYTAQVPAVIAKYGGRYLVRGGAVEVVEGDVSVNRQVILEFPDMTALKAFYFSEEYAPLKDVRLQAATGSILLIEGYQP